MAARDRCGNSSKSLFRLQLSSAPIAYRAAEAMASDTKQQTTYKKRVISESDDEDSSSGHEGDVPLARTAGTVTANRAAEAPALAKTASDEGKHNPSDVAAGSVLLKEAIGHGDPSQVSLSAMLPAPKFPFESSRRRSNKLFYEHKPVVADHYALVSQSASVLPLL